LQNHYGNRGHERQKRFRDDYNNFAKALAYQHILNTEQSYYHKPIRWERHLLMLDALGQFNEISLANINSCSFIATQDLGKKKSQQLFRGIGTF
jgi:hypothetical protein